MNVAGVPGPSSMLPLACQVPAGRSAVTLTAAPATAAPLASVTDSCTRQQSSSCSVAPSWRTGTSDQPATGSLASTCSVASASTTNKVPRVAPAGWLNTAVTSGCSGIGSVKLSGRSPGLPYSEITVTVVPNSMAKPNRPPSCQTATWSGPSADPVDPMSASPSVSLSGVEKKMSPDGTW